MTIEIFSSESMAHAFNSDWIETKQPSAQSGRKSSAELNSIQISWREVSQLSQSTVEILLSNDCETSVKAAAFVVDATSNETDAIVAFVCPLFRYFSVAFAPMTTMDGKLSVSAYYSD